MVEGSLQEQQEYQRCKAYTRRVAFDPKQVSARAAAHSYTKIAMNLQLRVQVEACGDVHYNLEARHTTQRDLNFIRTSERRS